MRILFTSLLCVLALSLSAITLLIISSSFSFAHEADNVFILPSFTVDATLGGATSGFIVHTTNTTTDIDSSCPNPEVYTWSVSNGVQGVDWDFVEGTSVNDFNVAIEFISQGCYLIQMSVLECATQGSATPIGITVAGRGAPANIPLTPSDDTWYHLALVYNNTNAVFSTYLDGLQMASNTAYDDPIVPYIDLLIGNNIENGNHFFHGNIDDISLWSLALSQQQIQSYMSTPPTGNEECLVGYWDFNEGTGSALTDQTSNGNDGVINGATWSTDVPTAP